MRPWQHARLSADRGGRDWREDLPIHEFLDVTKGAHPDLRHRLVLHNQDLGPALTELAFPGRTDAREIACQHVLEDLGNTPSLADWLSGCDLRCLPKPSCDDPDRNLEDLVDMAVSRQKLASDVGPRRVLAVLTLPLRICRGFGSAPLAILCNSAGPTIIRHVLGPPHEVESVHGSNVVFDPGWTAEAMIWWLMGKRIPALSDVVSAVRTLPGRAERIDPDVT